MTRFSRTPPSFMEKEQFIELFGGVYEHSPWVAEVLFNGGVGQDYDWVDELAEAMAVVVEQAGDACQLELLRFHPDLAGKLAAAGDLTQASASEQVSAGLDQCSPEELATFKELNAMYNSKFGFPFIMAVRDRCRTEILGALRSRLGNTFDKEKRKALDQVHRIALLRLQDIAGEG